MQERNQNGMRNLRSKRAYPGGEDHKYKLIFRIMNHHKHTADDFIGETT